MWHKNGGILDNYFNNARSTTLDRKERVAENKNHNKENDKNNRFWRITQNWIKKWTLLKMAIGISATGHETRTKQWRTEKKTEYVQ